MFCFRKKDQNKFSVVVILSVLLAWMALDGRGVRGQGWTDMKIRLLPDPQIGPVFAVIIVEYRDAHGLFMAAEDIQKVNGKGQGTFNAIRHYISVN